MSNGPPANTAEALTARLIRAVCERLDANEPARRKLPGGGRVHIDRQLPFLCVYRRPVDVPDEGTERLTTIEASYLTATLAAGEQASVSRLVQAVVQTLAPQFGAFLVLEVWSGGPPPTPDTEGELTPGFRLFATRGAESGPFLDAFVEALTRVAVVGRTAEVEVVWTKHRTPRGAPPLLPAATARRLRCTLLGLEVRPVYRNPATGEVYPLLMREFLHGLTRALKQAFHHFACTQTTQCPVHYHVLGPRALVKSVWEVDRQLADVADTFDYLLQVTPVNAERAWLDFKNSRYRAVPVFHYRPLPVDPILLKRRLYATPVERIEDPALAQLFREKMDEIDRQLTMLQDIGTPRFVHGSIPLFGGVEDGLLALARELLDRIPASSKEDLRGGSIGAEEFADRARDELAWYRDRMPDFDATVQVRDDVAGGMMVSQGSLLVARHTRVPADRVEALLQHEVGTHVLTYYNGRAQPFRQLYSGLAGYESLQEGLAVLAEYLVGGLSRPRLRLLAARVVAVRRMIEGASFLEAFRELVEGFGFERKGAFTITMRVYRGGGLTKDACYLRGLCQVLEHLGSGGVLGPLFVGKIAAEHIPIIRELHWREVLQHPPLAPRYMDRPETERRLAPLRSGVTVLDLLKSGRLRLQ